MGDGGAEGCTLGTAVGRIMGALVEVGAQEGCTDDRAVGADDKCTEGCALRETVGLAVWTVGKAVVGPLLGDKLLVVGSSDGAQVGVAERTGVGAIVGLTSGLVKLLW